MLLDSGFGQIRKATACLVWSETHDSSLFNLFCEHTMLAGPATRGLGLTGGLSWGLGGGPPKMDFWTFGPSEVQSNVSCPHPSGCFSPHFDSNRVRFAMSFQAVTWFLLRTVSRSPLGRLLLTPYYKPGKHRSQVQDPLQNGLRSCLATIFCLVEQLLKKQ